jgi:hypothetical protein
MVKPPDVPRLKIPFTPLADLTFLLLVYFLFTAKFVNLESRMEAYLPLDRGHH